VNNRYDKAVTLEKEHPVIYYTWLATTLLLLCACGMQCCFHKRGCCRNRLPECLCVDEGARSFDTAPCCYR
jgi:hypothetical protein